MGKVKVFDLSTWHAVEEPFSCDLTSEQDGERKEEGWRGGELGRWRADPEVDQDRAVGGEAEGGGGEGGERGGGGDGGGAHHQNAPRDSQSCLFYFTSQVSNLSLKEENSWNSIFSSGILATPWLSAPSGMTLGEGLTCGKSTGGSEKWVFWDLRLLFTREALLRVLKSLRWPKEVFWLLRVIWNYEKGKFFMGFKSFLLEENLGHFYRLWNGLSSFKYF